MKRGKGGKASNNSEPSQTEQKHVQKKSKVKTLNEDSDVLWAMTAQQSADLKALHDSIQLGSHDTESSPEAPPQLPLAQPEDKPAVGSLEWHQRRRESHKLVERKRREAINDGINKIASIIPGCEKNKGSILNCAANYIKQLKDREAELLERVSLEKLLTEQSVQQLRHQLASSQKLVQNLDEKSESLRKQLECALVENESLKKILDSSHD